MAGAIRKVKVLDPTSERKIERVSIANRLNSLEGKVIGLLDNSKAMADVFLGRIEERLSSEYQMNRFFWYRKATPATGMPQTAMTEFIKCDAVIVGIAD